MAISQQSYTYKEHTITIALGTEDNVNFSVVAIIQGPVVTRKYFVKRNLTRQEAIQAIRDLKAQAESYVDQKVAEQQNSGSNNTGNNTGTTTNTTNNCVPGRVIDESSITYKEHVVKGQKIDMCGTYTAKVIVSGPEVNKTYQKTGLTDTNYRTEASGLILQAKSDIDNAIAQNNQNQCNPGTVLDQSSISYKQHTVTAKKKDNCDGTYTEEIIVTGPKVNKTYTGTSTDANHVQVAYQLISQAKSDIDAAYSTTGTEGNEGTGNTGTNQGTGATGNTGTTGGTQQSTTIYTAPNGKKYIIHYDPENYPDTPYWFDGGRGVKFNRTMDEAKYVIDSTNGPNVPNDQLGEYYTGQVNRGSIGQGGNSGGNVGGNTGGNNTGNMGGIGGETTSGMESGPNATIPLTGKEDVDRYLKAMANYNESLNNWLKQNLDLNVGEWKNVLDKIQDVNLKGQIQKRITRLNQGFKTAANHLKAASELEQRAQAIYNNENIRKMREMLIQKGYDTAKASTAAFYVATKERAKLSADVYKIKSEFEKTLANLEAQRTQLEDNIRREGMEADKWIIDKQAQITQQIQNLRKIYEQYVINNTDRYIMKPMIDIMSSNWQVELKLIAKEKEAQLLNANPTIKIMEAAKIFGSDWAYVDSSVLRYASADWQTFLTKAAESIRRNKINEQKSIMREQTNQQKELMQFQYELQNQNNNE